MKKDESQNPDEANLEQEAERFRDFILERLNAVESSPYSCPYCGHTEPPVLDSIIAQIPGRQYAGMGMRQFRTEHHFPCAVLLCTRCGSMSFHNILMLLDGVEHNFEVFKLTADEGSHKEKSQ
jgi:hypothetical protein